MEPTLISKVSVRLPNFITLFFSISLVTGFRILADHYHWSTNPTFSFETINDSLLLASYMVTLFFVVTAWIAYSVLIERSSYQFSIRRFFFDVMRFVLMFALLLWSFLGEKPDHYQVFIFGIAAYHLLLSLWYVAGFGTSHTGATGKFSYKHDLWPHALAFIIYTPLGIFYKMAVTGATSEPNQAMYHNIIVIITLVVVLGWCIWRLSELKQRLVKESQTV